MEMVAPMELIPSVIGNVREVHLASWYVACAGLSAYTLEA